MDTLITSPLFCFAPYQNIFVAQMMDNCTPNEALNVTANAKFQSGQMTPMDVASVSGGYNISIPLAFGNSLPVGLNTITVYAQDESGNVDSCQWTVLVKDIWAPTLANCPANITVSVNPSTCTGVANWLPPTASDNCSGVAVSATHLPGSSFPGPPNNVTTVTYTATDGSGNTAVCSFTVTVEGTCTPPAPDLSPEHVTGSTSYLTGQTKNVVVRVRNLSPNPTTAPVVFFVQKILPNFTITPLPNSTTTVTVAGVPYTLNNSEFTIVEQPTRWRFTSNTGVVIPGNSTKFIGMSVTAIGLPGNMGNMTTTVVNGTGGGETPTNNNIKVSTLSIN
jgi:hypothetical protein